MAETQGVTGFGTKVYMKVSGAFIEITEPKDIAGPEITLEYADMTHQQSPAGFRERVPTFKSSGTVTFKVNVVHHDSSYQALCAAAIANPPTLCEFYNYYPDHSKIDYKAYVGLRWDAPMANAFEATVTLTLKGNLGIAVPSSSTSASESVSVSASASSSASAS